MQGLDFSGRSLRGKRGKARTAVALAFGFCASGVFLALFADCGGNAFTSANGASGSAPGGASGTGAIAGSSSGGTSSFAGSSSGGSAQAGTSAGGTSPSAGNGGTNSGGTSSGGTNSAGSGGMNSAGAGGMVLDKCPVDPPASGACKTGLECTYGDDLRAECRDRYSCVDAAWQSQLAKCAKLETCLEVDGGLRQVGTTCPTVGVECTLDNGSSGSVYCRCDLHENGGMQIWDCQGPPNSPCPQVVPNEGQPCDGSANNAMCAYGNCNFGASSVADMQCTNGVWTEIGAGCATAG